MVDKFSVEKNNQKNRQKKSTMMFNSHWTLACNRFEWEFRATNDMETPMETFGFSCIKTMVIIIDCESSKFFVQFSKFLCQRLRAKKNFEIHFMPHIQPCWKSLSRRSLRGICVRQLVGSSISMRTLFPIICSFIFEVSHRIRTFFWGYILFIGIDCFSFIFYFLDECLRSFVEKFGRQHQ